MEMILGLKATMDQVQVKRFCFGYFCRFLISALTLRSRNTYIYVFRALFGFGNFLSTSCEFHKLGVSSCAAHQYIEITGFFLRFQTKERILRVNKSKITGENKFIGDQFGVEGNHGSSKNEKVLF